MVLYSLKDDGRFKVRMVARGDRQTADTYDVTHSPVVRTTTLRFIIAVAAIYDLDVYQTDVNTAYLNAPIDFDIYFIAPDCFPNPGAYLRAKKAIYGLKQAGVCWYMELEEKLIDMGFQRTIFDYCVWGTVRGDSPILIATYVDDLLFIGTDENCRAVLNELKSYYICRDDQKLATFLGMDFSRDNRENSHSRYDICMRNYILRYANSRGIGLQNRLKLSKTPGATKDVTSESLTPENLLDPIEKKTFQSLVGAFQWITGCCRPDITFITQSLASATNSPYRAHLDLAWKTLGYLMRTASAKLQLGGNLLSPPPSAQHPQNLVFGDSEPTANNSTDLDDLKLADREAADHFSDKTHIDFSPVDGFARLDLDDPRGIAVPLHAVFSKFNKTVKITVYTDADFAGETAERRSTIGYVIYLNSAPIKWTTKRIKSVTTSTFETECIAISEACEAVKEFIHLGQSLGIHIDLPVTIYNDNLSTALVATNQASSPKKKHVQIRFHHIRNFARNGVAEILHCGTTEMVADLFTKSLGRNQHYALAERMLTFDRDQP